MNIEQNNEIQVIQCTIRVIQAIDIEYYAEYRDFFGNLTIKTEKKIDISGRFHLKFS